MEKQYAFTYLHGYCSLWVDSNRPLYIRTSHIRVLESIGIPHSLAKAGTAVYKDNITGKSVNTLFHDWTHIENNLLHPSLRLTEKVIKKLSDGVNFMKLRLTHPTMLKYLCGYIIRRILRPPDFHRKLTRLSHESHLSQKLIDDYIAMKGISDNIAEAGRLRLPCGTYGSLRQNIAAAHSEAGRRRLCQIKNAHAMAWWREADAGWLPACRCRPGAGSTGCAGLNAAHGVTTGCQRRSASGCADVDRDRDDRAVYGGEHALPTDVTIGTADPGLSEWRKVTCGAFSGFPTNFGSLSHQLSPSCREPSLSCTAQLTGIGGSSFLSRKCASSSVFIFVYTIHR